MEWLHSQQVSLVLKPLVALLLTLPFAYEREQSTNIMGLRTYPLVSLGACSYVMIGLLTFPADSADAMARTLQGILSGLGFIGGGAIIKSAEGVRGTASAATIWVTGSVGAAVGFGCYALALVVSLLSLTILKVLKSFKFGLGPESGATDVFDASAKEESSSS